MSSDADFFKNLANAKKAEEKREEAERQTSFDYTPLFWSAFKNTGESKLIRLKDPIIIEKKADLKITGPDNTPIFDKYSGRVTEMVWLYNDSGKRKLFFVPSKDENPSHIFWKLRDLILKREWVADPDSVNGKKKPLYVNAIAHPELVDRFLTNGYNHNISKNKYDRGWKSQQVLMTNVLDRELMDIHRERKSWALLSKNVNIIKAEQEGQSDVAYYDWGVPAYGFVGQLRDVISHYGGLDSYDLIVERTGEKDTPWKIRNASIYKAEVPEYLQSLISEKETLSEEQLSWEMYDIESITAPSSTLKWFKNFKNLFLEIDLKFKTNYHDTLEKIAEKEEAELKEKEAQKDKSTSTGIVKKEENNSIKKEEKTPTRSRVRTPVEKSSKSEDISWETLHKFGYKVKEEDFTSEIKALIDHITSDGRVVWKEGLELIPDDDQCGYEAISGIKGAGFESPDLPEVPLCLWCGRPW